MTTDDQKTWEMVLPVSGRFARIRKPTVGDFLLTLGHENPALALAARVITIDDERITAEQLGQMDIDEAAPMLARIGKILDAIKPFGLG